MKLAALAAAALATGCAPVAAETPALPAEYAAFVDEMAAEHGLDRADLAALLAGAQMRQEIIDAITRPAEALPWHRYRGIFVTDARTDGGVRFWTEHRDTVARAAREYGVAPEVIVAIIGVESNYGRIQGRYPVVDALVTLGFHYPPRAAFFRGELEHFVLLARDERLDPAAMRGSYAGAMGSPQFISSSYRAYAVDFDGDGTRDLWNSWPDIIGSIANYFHQHRWRPGEPVAARATLRVPAAAALATRALDTGTTVGELRAAGVLPAMQLADGMRANLLMLETSPDGAVEHWVTLHNFFVITRYNRSPLYAMAVHQLARAILDRMGSDPIPESGDD